MEAEAIKTIENKELGLKAIIACGNSEFNYRVTCKCTDLDEKDTVLLCHAYNKAQELAIEFLNQGALDAA